MTRDIPRALRAPLPPLAGALLLAFAFSGCCSCPEHDDDPEGAGGMGATGAGGSAKEGRPFGANCDNDKQCGTAEVDGELKELFCLTQFDGGYCSFTSCSDKSDCPSGAHCVELQGAEFCFLDCTHEDECNRDRSSASPAVCTFDFENGTPDESEALKACLPPKE